MSVDVLTVSSKGQIVLPASMRKKLSIKSGAKLAAYASGDVIMLKPIKIPTEKDFEDKSDEARKWAASVVSQEKEMDER